MTADEPPGDERARSEPQFLRPFGHVASDPVVRRVDGRELFVGNAPAADPTPTTDASRSSRRSRRRPIR